MRVLLAEYAVGTSLERGLLREGKAMLETLAVSFRKAGCEVVTPRPGRFEQDLERLAADSDYGLVIAPDEHLAYYTSIIEDNTVNLGSSPDSVKLCADKLRTTEILSESGIAVADDAPSTRYVLKPRWGCGSEGIIVTDDPSILPEGFIRTRLIEGEHISVSLLRSPSGITLPITINKQIVEITPRKIRYRGGVTPYFPPRADEILNAGMRAGEILGCSGYFGVDIVLADRPYIVDVNPRPTTSIIGINQVIDREIGGLILDARLERLPESINIIEREVTYRLDEL
ncbi:MAG: ATP-grasp domain-containing protein [Candidatus Syntrophoarchaeum sp. WYZ-LMO15]|nr:MAG: ATP-grasp domain-containing protein [Candidatus Syntrophoarchaeum sp. WYZ-LMO15]